MDTVAAKINANVIPMISIELLSIEAANTTTATPILVPTHRRSAIGARALRDLRGLAMSECIRSENKHAMALRQARASAPHIVSVLLRNALSARLRRNALLAPLGLLPNLS